MLEKLLTAPLPHAAQDPAEPGGSAGGLRRPGCTSATLPSDESCFCFPVGYGYVLRWSGTAHKRQGLTEGSQLRECQSSLASVG